MNIEELKNKNVKDSRKNRIEIFYEGKNITQNIHNQLLSCSQSDSINELDSLELTLENKEMYWLGSWFPQKGDILKTILILENWEIDGNIVVHDMGEFYIDSINFSGPPDVVNIRAISYDLNSDIVDKKENHVWENVDFKTIITEIAKNRKIELISDISFNRKYQRIEQKLQSDFDFLKSLCEEAGANLKLFNNKIVIFEEEKYEKREPKMTFNKSNIASYSFSTDDTDSYSSCTICYYDYKRKKKIERKFFLKNRNSYKKKNERDLFINEDKQITGKNKEEINKQLLEIAKKALREKNKKEVKASVTFMGREKLLSVGDTVILSDFINFSGKYIIDNLNINLFSYEITADMHKIMEMEVEE